MAWALYDALVIVQLLLKLKAEFLTQRMFTPLNVDQSFREYSGFSDLGDQRGGPFSHGHLWAPPPVSMVALEKKTSQGLLLRAPSQKNGIPLALAGNISSFPV